MKHYITLPNGRRTGLRTYARAWKAIAANPAGNYPGFDYFPIRGAEILEKIRAGLHERINRHLSGYNTGRKWADDWQRITIYSARLLNTPRLAIDYLPPHLETRFARRLRDRDAV